MKVVDLGLDHEAEFLRFGLFLSLGSSKPMTRPRTCKNVSFRIRQKIEMTLKAKKYFLFCNTVKTQNCTMYSCISVISTATIQNV